MRRLGWLRARFLHPRRPDQSAQRCSLVRGITADNGFLETVEATMNAMIYQEHKLRELHHVRAESQTNAPDKRAHWGRLERCALTGTETGTNTAAGRLAAAQRDSWLPRRRQLQGRVRSGTRVPDRVLRDHHQGRRRREGAHPERLGEPPQIADVPPLPLLPAWLTMVG